MSLWRRAGGGGWQRAFLCIHCCWCIHLDKRQKKDGCPSWSLISCAFNRLFMKWFYGFYSCPLEIKLVVWELDTPGLDCSPSNISTDHRLIIMIKAVHLTAGSVQTSLKEPVPASRSRVLHHTLLFCGHQSKQFAKSYFTIHVSFGGSMWYTRLQHQREMSEELIAADLHDLKIHRRSVADSERWSQSSQTESEAHLKAVRSRGTVGTLNILSAADL